MGLFGSRKSRSASRGRQTPVPVKKNQLFVFYAIETRGHINPLLCIADVLKERGHRTVFLCQRHIGTIEHELICLKDYQSPSSPPDQLAPQEPQKTSTSASTSTSTAHLGETSGQASEADESMAKTLDQMSMTKGAEESLVDIFKNVGVSFTKSLGEPKLDDTLRQALDDLQPDVIVVDHGSIVPAIMSPFSPYKWARIYSASPLLLYSLKYPEKFPAPFLGVPVMDISEDERQHSWNSYTKAAEKTTEVNKVLAKRAQIRDDSVHHYLCDSPYLNFYVYPEALDYHHHLGHQLDNWIRCQSMVRYCMLPDRLANSANRKPLPVPLAHFMDEARRHRHKLVYVSMGTLASVDQDLMKRLVACLGQSEHRFILSMGIRREGLELGLNIWGDRYLPQKELLGMVDAAVIHGGNNSFTECLQIGVPGMVLCPMFADQFDNARRLVEKQLGVAVYFSKPEPERKLLEAISTVLTNDTMRQNIDKISREMREAEYDGPELVANHLEMLAQQY